MRILEHVDWHQDHFNLAGYTFRLQHQHNEGTAADAFLFYKSRMQIEQYERFFRESTFSPRKMLELGIWTAEVRPSGLRY